MRCGLVKIMGVALIRWGHISVGVMMGTPGRTVLQVTFRAEVSFKSYKHKHESYVSIFQELAMPDIVFLFINARFGAKWIYEMKIKYMNI